MEEPARPAPNAIARMQSRAATVIGDRAARGLFTAAALFVLAALGFIIWVLFSRAYAFFQEVSIVEFLTSTKWEVIDPKEIAWGIWPLMTGTLMVAVGAILIGLPIGLATAIFLAEYASPRLRATLKPVLELLAGVPSIVFGFFAVQAISPIWQGLTEPGDLLYHLNDGPARVFNAMNAIVVIGIMVIPIIASFSEDAIRAVPRHLREASLGLGATRWETTRHVVLPAALSGITASVVLATARAIGETMAVALAAGTQANFTFNPLDSIQTMTSFIAQRFGTDQDLTGVAEDSMYAVGATLFTMTLLLNLVAQRFVRKYREVETQ